MTPPVNTAQVYLLMSDIITQPISIHLIYAQEWNLNYFFL